MRPVDPRARGDPCSAGCWTQREQDLPLYAAKVEHLRANRAVSVACRACSHLAEIESVDIQAKLTGWFRVQELWRVMRCTRAAGAATAR